MMATNKGKLIIITGYEGKKICNWCGGNFKTKRQRSYCGKECSEAYLDNFDWQRAAWLAKKRAKNKCEKCGKNEGSITYGKFKDMYRSDLEVHHIDPIDGEFRGWHAKNVQSNLIVLCVTCHKKEHAKRK